TLVEIVSTPPIAPSVAGVNLTDAAHAALEARAPQLCDTAKFGEAVTAFTVSPAPSELVNVTGCPGDVVFIDCPPKSSDDGLGTNTPTTVLKIAVTDRVAFIVSWHGPERLLQAPLQPEKKRP